MENLSKENYWNDMMERFPSAMKDFCEWIDKYKAANEWEVMFWNGRRALDIKFHDIPFEMQYGVIFKYFRDEKGMDDIWAYACVMSEEWEIKHLITELFAKQFAIDIAKSDPTFTLDEEF